MMTEFSILGVHCLECAEDLENKLNAVQNENSIEVDYKNQKLILKNDTIDYSKVLKILEFEKVSIKEMDYDDITEHNHASHGHDHHGLDKLVQQDTTTKIAIVFFLNLFFSVIEFVFGLLFNSMAILTDAVHDLGDAISIGFAWVFEKISTKEANDQYSFGHQRFSLLGALFTAIVLLVGSAIVLYHSVPRVFNAESVNYQGMFWLAIFAILANGFSAWLLSKGATHNESVLNLHMLEDLLGWVGVLLVSIILRFTDWYFLDPLLSIVIAIFIMYKTWPVFKETVEIFLEATPKEVPRVDIKNQIRSIKGVTNLSHLHIWSIDGREHALTVTISTDTDDARLHTQMKEDIRKVILPYGITHSTIEFVYDPGHLLSS